MKECPHKNTFVKFYMIILSLAKYTIKSMSLLIPTMQMLSSVYYVHRLGQYYEHYGHLKLTNTTLMKEHDSFKASK